MNNSPTNEELDKISKLRQKLYSRSLTSNASRLDPLHKHTLDIPSSWEEVNKPEKKQIDNQIEQPKYNTPSPLNKESIKDFLEQKFSSERSNSYSDVRVGRIENKIAQTNIALTMAQSKLTAKGGEIYSNLKPAEEKNKSTEPTSDFQNDYHPEYAKIKIGDSADRQGLGLTPKKKQVNWSFGFIIFMVIFFFFVGTSFYTYITLIKGTNTISTSKIDIKVTGPVSVKSGEVSDFIIDITNNNTTDIILSDLVIQYPDGSKSSIDKTQDLNNERISVGTIHPGQTVREKNSVVFFGEQNAKKNISYSYEFNINDSSTIFKTNKDVGVFISGSPISVTVSNVKEINNNQELNFDIDLTSNTEENLKNIQVKAEYPFGFKPISATPASGLDGGTWSFDSIDSLSSTTIHLKGKFVGETNVDKNFRFTLGIEDPATKNMLTVLSTQDVQVAIRKPFLVTNLLIEGDSSDFKSVDYGQNLKADLTITNNLSNSVNDVQIQVLLNGVIIDRRTVNSNDGFYDSNKDMIIWDKSLNDGLSSIAPGESRELSFNIATIASTDSLIKTLKRSTSDITVNVNAQRLNETRVPEVINTSTKKQLRLKTSVLFNENMFYDSGTYSPEVNNETIFKYVGNISNTANNITNTTFMAKLPPNATWKGVYGPDIPSSSIKYNQSTREITISLGDIDAGSGIDKPSKQFYFKFGFTPTLTQTGQSPKVIISPTFTGTDSFTSDSIQVKAQDMTTGITSGVHAYDDSKVK